MQCNGVTGKGARCTRAATPGHHQCKTHCRTTTAKAGRNAATNARRAEQERLFAAAAASMPVATAPVSPATAKHFRTLNLNITRRHSPTTVRKAYLEKARQTHPDRPGGNAEEFKKIKAAFNALSKIQ